MQFVKQTLPVLKTIALSLVFMGLLLGCKKEDQASIDDGIIQNYLKEHNIDAKPYNGIYIYTTVQGTGANPNAYSTVKVNYKGYLTDGTVFDQNNGLTFNLQQVIKGWTYGIPLMRVGGKATLFIPSTLGYGSNATGKIPANSVLIFDVELLKIL
jgi:FKBP-type peptidyl-prolyl cis-trans isomerase FkpA